MTDTAEYQTRHMGLASFLRFVLGDNSHLATVKKEARGVYFVFRDEPRGTCREYETAFFSPESVAIGSARELLECDRAIRSTITKCVNSAAGYWERKIEE